MQVLKRHQKIVLISSIIVIIIVVSLIVIENVNNTSTQPSPTSTPLPSSPLPTGTSPKPTITQTPTATSKPTPTPVLQSGEVSQYNGTDLTPISQYIQDIAAHPDVAIEGPQDVNRSTYQLAITGLVNSPQKYTYNDIVNNFNSTMQVATLFCVEGWSVTLLWQGVPINALLQQAGVSQNANTLIFLAADGYSTSLPLDFVTQNNIMIAYKMNNVTLTSQTGWPFFLVAKNQYGYKWIEWITEINVSNDSSYQGYWESRGYPINATVDNSNGSNPLNNSATIPLLATVSIVVILIAIAVYGTRFKTRKQRKTGTIELNER